MRIRSEWAPWAWTLTVVVLALAFTWLSLANVSGATLHSDGTCCNTEYEHGWWSLAPTLLTTPVYLIARSSRSVPLVVAVAFSSACVFYIAYTAVTRIEDAGWGDGLERLAYVEAAIQAGLFVAAGLIGFRRRVVMTPDPPYPPIGALGPPRTGPSEEDKP